MICRLYIYIYILNHRGLKYRSNISTNLCLETTTTDALKQQNPPNTTSHTTTIVRLDSKTLSPRISKDHQRPTFKTKEVLPVSTGNPGWHGIQHGRIRATTGSSASALRLFGRSGPLQMAVGSQHTRSTLAAWNNLWSPVRTEVMKTRRLHSSKRFWPTHKSSPFLGCRSSSFLVTSAQTGCLLPWPFRRGLSMEPSPSPRYPAKRNRMQKCASQIK